MTTEQMQNRSLCLAVSFTMWGVNRRIAITPDAETAADKTMLKTTKKLLEAPEYTAIRSCDGDLKRYLRTKCVPFPLQRSVYLVPIAILSEVQRGIEERLAQRAEAVNAFVNAMPRLRDEALLRLADLGDKSEYPLGDNLRSQFRVDTAYVSFDVPGTLKELDSALFSEEQRKAQLRWKEAAEEIRYAMREAFAKLVSHLTEKLTAAPDGKKKVIRDSAVDNLKEFLDSFAVRNLADDGELAKLVEKANRIVSGLDPERLRKDETLQQRVSQEMSKVCTAVDKMLVDRPARRFAFDEE